MKKTKDKPDYEKLIRAVREEERIRIIGIIEYYFTVLGDDSYDRIVKHILKHVIKTIEHNSD